MTLWVRQLQTHSNAQFTSDHSQGELHFVQQCFSIVINDDNRKTDIGTYYVKLLILTDNVETSAPFCTSHNFAVVSILPVATIVLCGLNATHTCTRK